MSVLQTITGKRVLLVESRESAKKCLRDQAMKKKNAQTTHRPGELPHKRAALQLITSKQRSEIAENTNRARFAKTKKSRQPHD